MLEPKVTTNIARFAQGLEAKFGPRVGQALLAASEVVAGQIRREISAWTSNTEERKTGALARSFVGKMSKNESRQIVVGVYSRLPYARIHNLGGVIRAKGKKLAIPLTQQARRRRASRFPGPMFLLKRPGRPPILMSLKGPGKRKHGPSNATPQYVLLSSVRIKPKYYLTKAADASTPVAREMVRKATQEAIAASRQ
jgi:hypothetical protein